MENKMNQKIKNKDEEIFKSSNIFKNYERKIKVFI